MPLTAPSLESLHSQLQEDFANQAATHQALTRRTDLAQRTCADVQHDIQRISAEKLELESALQREAELLAELRAGKAQLDDSNAECGLEEKRAVAQRRADRETYCSALRGQASAVYAHFLKAKGSPDEALSVVSDIEAYVAKVEAVLEALAAAGATGGTPAVWERLIGQAASAQALLNAYGELAIALKGEGKGK